MTKQITDPMRIKRICSTARRDHRGEYVMFEGEVNNSGLFGTSYIRTPVLLTKISASLTGCPKKIEILAEEFNPDQMRTRRIQVSIKTFRWICFATELRRSMATENNWVYNDSTIYPELQRFNAKFLTIGERDIYERLREISAGKLGGIRKDLVYVLKDQIQQNRPQFDSSSVSVNDFRASFGLPYKTEPLCWD
jgi:hypothetical protein